MNQKRNLDGTFAKDLAGTENYHEWQVAQLERAHARPRERGLAVAPRLLAEKPGPGDDPVEYWRCWDESRHRAVQARYQRHSATLRDGVPACPVCGAPMQHVGNYSAKLQTIVPRGWEVV